MKRQNFNGAEFLRQVGMEYDHKVTVLLKAIDLAEETKDVQRLVGLRSVALSWVSYFEYLREKIDRNRTAKDPSTKETLEFIGEQIRFFSLLAQEVKKKIYELNIKNNLRLA
ncbi:MAG: hypothetical protein JW727_03140 [Candidatus Aenigmarchaeota archaeon]|nr:hypothetical protein [Candidatus Aenigmarchaeota archaeon]